ncbi:hypothetical protein Bpfe_003275, partial [Biomphalaria pfeifferi]
IPPCGISQKQCRGSSPIAFKYFSETMQRLIANRLQIFLRNNAEALTNRLQIFLRNNDEAHHQSPSNISQKQC